MVPLMFEAASAQDASATAPSLQEPCSHEAHFPPTPTDGPTRQCRHCPHVWQAPCVCGMASWKPEAHWRADGAGVVVWTCTGCGLRYGADREHSQAQPAVVSPAGSWRCYCCKGTRRWRASDGVMLCGTCHPPGSVALVDAWVENGVAVSP